jgi:hypothetical protein
MRAKFRLIAVTKRVDAYDLWFTAVAGDSDENKRFWKYTPSGELKLTTVNPDVVKGLEPGTEYYLDIAPAQ